MSINFKLQNYEISDLTQYQRVGIFYYVVLLKQRCENSIVGIIKVILIKHFITFINHPANLKF